MHRVLDLAERVMRDGVMIGAYFSQWFANTTLQPLDHALRERGPEVTHYLRYMDNFTLYARSKRQLDRAIKMIEDWLRAHDLTIKGDWQKFRTADRMTYGALGYDGNELMAFISGYDLEIKFNLRLINSLADAEACADALAQVFYDALMEQLLCNEKAGFVKPPGHKPATLSEKEGRNDVRQDSEHAG